MALLNSSDRNAASKSIQKGLEDLVVSDEVLQNYRTKLDAMLTSAKAGVQLSDPGRFVASVDSASTAAITAYMASILKHTSTAGTSTTAASTPSQAMTAYLKAKGIDSSSMSFSVASTSSSNPNWKIDQGAESGSSPVFFLLESVNGEWTVVDYGTSFTAAKLKADGAPSDLTPP